MAESLLPTHNAVGQFSTKQLAETAVRALEEAGFERESISLMPRSLDPDPPSEETEAVSNAGSGAIAGTVFGALVGLLLSYISLTLPNSLEVEPVRHLIGFTLIGSGFGAAAGSVIAAVTGTYVSQGVAEPERRDLREQYLVFVEGNSEDQSRARNIVEQQQGATK